MSPMVETDMRPRVRDWENVLHQMRTVLHELGVEEDQTNVSFEHQMLAENAPEQYDGQFLDDQTEKSDEKNIQEDNTILGVVVDPGLRNAVAGSVVTILSLAVQGMYSLYVLDESPSESLL